MTFEIYLWLLKFIHLSTISLWAGGLLCLPTLIALNRPEEDVPLHKTVRFLYVVLVSPAALVAIASGTALIFMQGAYDEWFSAKMAAVGLMVILHVFTGLRLVASFSRGLMFSIIPATMLTISLLSVIAAILWIVLAKPDYDLSGFYETVFQPGYLGEHYPYLKFWENLNFWQE